MLQTSRDIQSMTMNGPYVAIGIKGFQGELVTAYFFNIYQQQNMIKMNYQKTKISQVALSKNGKYLLSLGNSDQNTQDFVIINTHQDFIIATKIFYRKTIKTKQKIIDMSFSNKNPLLFGLMYLNKFCFVKIIQQTQQIQEILIKSNKVRQFNNFFFDEQDKFCYTASKNGDIAQIDIKLNKQTRIGPKKRIIITGIKYIKPIDAQNIIIVGTKGFLAVVQIKDLKIIKQVTLNQQIISISQFIDGVAYISTQKAVIYKLYADTLQASAFYVCLKQKIRQVAYCQSIIQSVVTCSSNQIVIWSTKELKAQLKITLPKIQCESIAVDKYGKYIVSAWNDGIIRLFQAYNGKLLMKVQNCHPGPICKLIIDYNQTKIISGGQKGEIKAWNFKQDKIGLALGCMSHHIKPINQLKINPQRYDQMAACCQDGSYSIWNLQTYQMLYCYKVCNFLKDCYFEDAFTLQFVGSGSSMYRIVKANGVLKKKTQIQNSHTNSLVMFHDQIDSRVIMYGGENQYLYLMNYSTLGSKNQEKLQVKVYSEITSLKMLSDKSSVFVGTVDGLFLKIKYQQFMVEDQYRQKIGSPTSQLKSDKSKSPSYKF